MIQPREMWQRMIMFDFSSGAFSAWDFCCGKNVPLHPKKARKKNPFRFLDK